MAALDLVTDVYHASVRLEYNHIVVYVDPFHITKETHDAELVVITHEHSDHYSPEDIRQIAKEDTSFITVSSVADHLRRDLEIVDAYTIVVDWESPDVYIEDGIVVTPVIAKNKNHPQDVGIGIVLELGGYKYYFSGDTDVLASDVVCDVLFVVCDGIYNMPDFETRVLSEIKAMDVMPKLVVPYHYGYIAHSDGNGERLANALTAAGIPNTLFN